MVSSREGTPPATPLKGPSIANDFFLFSKSNRENPGDAFCVKSFRFDQVGLAEPGVVEVECAERLPSRSSVRNVAGPAKRRGKF